jgi:uncharacterized protein
MQKELRRKDKAVPYEDALKLLVAGEYGVLSTISADGSPYGVPINYWVIGNAVYFHCAVEGHKLENIAADDRVSFCVVGPSRVRPEKFDTLYESVIVSGRAEEVIDAEKQKALEALVIRYSGAFFQEGLRYIEADSKITRVFRFNIKELSGKAQKA